MNIDKNRHKPLDPASEAVQLVQAMRMSELQRRAAWLPTQARARASYHGWLARTRRTQNA